MVIALALETGIAPSVWAGEDERTLLTATQMVDDARRAANRRANQH